MSIKSTLAHGDNFHFYSEVFDDEHVYLCIKGAEFQASNRSVMVTIPLEIWEVIREHSIADFSYVGLTDEHLLSQVTREVREHIEAFSAADDRHKPIVALHRALVYGDVTDPEEEQIKKGMAYLQRLRSDQEQMLDKITSLRAENARC